MKEKICVQGIRIKVLRNLIILHNTLFERYEAYDWKGSEIYPDYRNYVWSQIKEGDVMEILGCSKRTAHDYLVVLKNFVS